MNESAVTERLVTVSRLLSARGLVVKAVDMSAGAIAARLKTQGALSDMCRKLGTLIAPR